MPNRIVREGILTSERVDALGDAAEVFYRRLMSAADDWGRYFAKPELLLAALYPLRIGRPDCPSHEQIARYVDECARAGLVRVYEIDGKKFVEIVDFRQQTRAKVKKFPDPPGVETVPCVCAADAKQMHSTCAADAQHMLRRDGDGDGDVFGDVFGREPIARSRAQKPRARAAPPSGERQVQKTETPAPVNGANGSHHPPEASADIVERIPIVGKSKTGEYAIRRGFVDELQAAYPAVDVPATLREMRAWCIANPSKRKTAAGVPRFVQRWIAQEQNRG